MPGPSSILAELKEIANGAIVLAFLWHLAIALVLMALLTGWRPSRAKALVLLSLPLISVSALAWVHGNGFNGTSFSLLAVVVLVAALSVEPAPVSAGPPWAMIAGGVLTFLGAVYPHFVEDIPVSAYLFAAPVGLLPCPTLMLVLGLTLVAGGFGSRFLSHVLAAAGVVYGVVGLVILEVSLDASLIAGALALGGFAASPRWRRSKESEPVGPRANRAGHGPSPMA